MEYEVMDLNSDLMPEGLRSLAQAMDKIETGIQVVPQKFKVGSLHPIVARHPADYLLPVLPNNS